jgi:hypothetical protein
VIPDRDLEFRRLYRDLRIRDQHTFYARRRDEYQRAHRQAVIVRNILLMVAGVCGVAGQAVEGAARAGWSVGAAVLGGMAAALIGYESLIGFSRLSKLYDDVARNLAEAELDWDNDDVPADVAAEMHRVEEVLRAENGQWGQLVVESAAALTPPVEADPIVKPPPRASAPPD